MSCAVKLVLLYLILGKLESTLCELCEKAWVDGGGGKHCPGRRVGTCRQQKQYETKLRKIGLDPLLQHTPKDCFNNDIRLKQEHFSPKNSFNFATSF